MAPNLEKLELSEVQNQGSSSLRSSQIQPENLSELNQRKGEGKGREGNNGMGEKVKLELERDRGALPVDGFLVGEALAEGENFVGLRS